MASLDPNELKTTGTENGDSWQVCHSSWKRNFSDVGEREIRDRGNLMLKACVIGLLNAKAGNQHVGLSDIIVAY